MTGRKAIARFNSGCHPPKLEDKGSPRVRSLTWRQKLKGKRKRSTNPKLARALTQRNPLSVASKDRKRCDPFALPSPSVLPYLIHIAQQKNSIWNRQNKGIASRQARDLKFEAVSKPTLERAQAALERKADLYNNLKRGRTGGLTEKQYESLLVDVCPISSRPFCS